LVLSLVHGSAVVCVLAAAVSSVWTVKNGCIMKEIKETFNQFVNRYLITMLVLSLSLNMIALCFMVWLILFPLFGVQK
jgi:hypothetical protein